MRRTMLLGVLLAVGGVGIVAGQAPQQPNVAEIEKVRDNLFMIKGGGGNTAAFVTASGVVLVDTKIANWGPAIMDKVRSVTDKPVTTIINTHTHGDHTGSNEFFPASVEVVAHENTKTNMEKMKQFEGEKAQFLPDRDLPGPDDASRRRRAHRAVPLRRRPHQRRHDRRLSGAARRPHRRPLRAAGNAAASTSTTAAAAWPIPRRMPKAATGHHGR